MDKSKTLLFVDDDQAMLNSLRRVFLDEPYETHFALSGKKALELMQQQDVDIVVSDMRMPGMDGQELLTTIKERYPRVIRIMFSGQPNVKQGEISTLIKMINQGDIFKFIGKTVNMNTDVINAIQEAIALD
jgi:two-component system, NtrC family, response regulator HupR/HoxA